MKLMQYVCVIPEYCGIVHYRCSRGSMIPKAKYVHCICKFRIYGKLTLYFVSIRKVYVVFFPGFRVGPRVSHIKYCNLYTGQDRQRRIDMKNRASCSPIIVTFLYIPYSGYDRGCIWSVSVTTSRHPTMSRGYKPNNPLLKGTVAVVIVVTVAVLAFMGSWGPYQPAAVTPSTSVKTSAIDVYT